MRKGKGCQEVADSASITTSIARHGHTIRGEEGGSLIHAAVLEHNTRTGVRENSPFRGQHDMPAASVDIHLDMKFGHMYFQLHIRDSLVSDVLRKSHNPTTSFFFCHFLICFAHTLTN